MLCRDYNIEESKIFGSSPLLKIVLCYLGKNKNYKFRLNCTKSECCNIPIYI